MIICVAVGHVCVLEDGAFSSVIRAGGFPFLQFLDLFCESVLIICVRQQRAFSSDHVQSVCKLQ